MAKVTMLNMTGAEAGTIELNDEIFGIEPNQNAVHAVVKNYLANQIPARKRFFTVSVSLRWHYPNQVLG